MTMSISCAPALRLTRSARTASRSSGIPGLRSSLCAGRTGTARRRSESAFMLAGECEWLLEKSTRSGYSGAVAAGFPCPCLLCLHALPVTLRRRRQQRRDLLAERLVAGRAAGLVRDEPTERERRVGRRGPVDQRLGRAEIARGTIRLARLVTEIDGLL